ncbi:MAG: DUF6345 domain-containing protein [Myxococcales bacterium]|nr:DUF6345 domain-containing protein [Myxococcales bacterium]
MVATIGIVWSDDLTWAGIQTERFVAAMKGVECSVTEHGTRGALAFRQPRELTREADINSGYDTADAASLVYFAGHGEPGKLITYGTDMLSNESTWAQQMVLGDGHLRWLVADGCRSLSLDFLKSSSKNWLTAFGGLRIILGWDYYANDEPLRGENFAERLLEGESLVEAWRHACEDTGDFVDMGNGQPFWAYLRAEKGGEATTSGDAWSTEAAPKAVISPDTFYWLSGSV